MQVEIIKLKLTLLVLDLKEFRDIFYIHINQTKT